MQFNRNFGLFDTCKMHFNPYLSLMLLAVFAIMFIFVKNCRQSCLPDNGRRADVSYTCTFS